MKKIVSLLLSAMLIFAVTACEDKETADEKDTKTIEEISADLSKITKSIIEAGDFPDMVERDKERMAKERHFGIDEASILAASCNYFPAGAYPDEITIIYTDASHAESIKDFLRKRIDDSADTWKDYQADQMSKLDNYVLETYGAYVVLFICDDSAAALKIFEDSLLKD